MRNQERDWVPIVALVMLAFILAVVNYAIVFALHGLPVVQYLLLGLLDAALVWLFTDNSSHSDI